MCAYTWQNDVLLWLGLPWFDCSSRLSGRYTCNDSMHIALEKDGLNLCSSRNPASILGGWVWYSYPSYSGTATKILSYSALIYISLCGHLNVAIFLHVFAAGILADSWYGRVTNDDQEKPSLSWARITMAEELLLQEINEFVCKSKKNPRYNMRITMYPSKDVSRVVTYYLCLFILPLFQQELPANVDSKAKIGIHLFTVWWWRWIAWCPIWNRRICCPNNVWHWCYHLSFPEEIVAVDKLTGNLMRWRIMTMGAYIKLSKVDVKIGSSELKNHKLLYTWERVIKGILAARNE